MENGKNWYVVYTKPRNEKKVADLLEKRKIMTYFPRYNEVQYWQEKQKVTNVPLFSSFIFVYASESDHAAIKQVDGVSGILYWLEKPAVISDEEIATIRYFLNQHINIRLEKIGVNANRNSNTKLNYLQKNMDGVIELNSLQKASLPSLGYALVSESMLENVKIVA